MIAYLTTSVLLSLKFKKKQKKKKKHTMYGYHRQRPEYQIDLES